MFVELCTSPSLLCFATEEYEGPASLVAEPHLDVNGFFFDVKAIKEVLDVLHLDVTRQATKPNTSAHVFLLKDSLEVNSLAAELVYHELVPLLVGELMKLDKAGTDILSFFLLDGTASFLRGLK